MNLAALLRPHLAHGVFFQDRFHCKVCLLHPDLDCILCYKYLLLGLQGRIVVGVSLGPPGQAGELNRLHQAVHGVHGISGLQRVTHLLTSNSTGFHNLEILHTLHH